MNRYDFEIAQGADHRFQLAIKTISQEGKKEHFDCSDCRAAMQVKSSPYTPRAIDTLTTENGRITCTDGNLDFVFPNSATAEYPPGVLVYDIKLINHAAEVSTILCGRIHVIAEVTRGVFA